ncbi:GNAT family N-acetyltransferase [Microbacterium sp. MAHUQ-60]|uniref:GNAT family N-acetyltransferase n=1 Tax=unclassified Microbacterium TaxID=2609290 RepID=UPI003618DFA1
MAQLTQQDGIAADAAVAASRAASAAAVTIRELPAVDEQADAIRLLTDIWKRAPENPPVPPELLRAMSKAGNYIAGAYDGEALIGVAIAFHMNPERHALHSHIAGISPAHVGRSAGFALKQHQRAWALAQGIDTIEWTYDPLVARNAHFNIAKLGAQAEEYLANFYGEIADGVNNDDETDRILVSWHLRSPQAIACAAGVPATAHRDPGDVHVAVPADVEQLRLVDRAAARRWRRTVRDQLTDLLDAGGRIIGFDRTGTDGTPGYLVRPGRSTP